MVQSWLLPWARKNTDMAETCWSMATENGKDRRRDPEISTFNTPRAARVTQHILQKGLQDATGLLSKALCWKLTSCWSFNVPSVQKTWITKDWAHYDIERWFLLTKVGTSEPLRLKATCFLCKNNQKHLSEIHRVLSVSLHWLLLGDCVYFQTAQLCSVSSP